MIYSEGLILAYDFTKWNGGNVVPNIAYPNSANSNNPYLYDSSVYRMFPSPNGIVKTIPRGYDGFLRSRTKLLMDTDFTIAANFKPTAANGNRGIIIGFGEYGISNRWGIQYGNNSQIGAEVNNGGISLATYMQVANPPINTYYNVVGMWDSVNKKTTLYINGEYVSENQNLLIPTISTLHYFKTGTISYNDTGFCKGIYRDVRLYNRLLSHEEITSFYKETSIQTPYLKEDFSSYPVILFPGKSWKKISGSSIISEISSSTENLKIGTKFLSGTGVSSIPCNIKYGVFSFDVIKYNTNQTLDFIFINSKSDESGQGYLIRFNILGEIHLYTLNNYGRANGTYIQQYEINKLYSIKIKSDYDRTADIWVNEEFKISSPINAYNISNYMNVVIYSNAGAVTNISVISL